jgi:hypothetical protein
MNTNQKKYTAFMESVCKEFHCPEMLPALNAGFKAFCEAIDTEKPKYYSFNDFENQVTNAMRWIFEEHDVPQPVRNRYYKAVEDVGDPLTREKDPVLKENIEHFFHEGTDEVAVANWIIDYLDNNKGEQKF